MLFHHYAFFCSKSSFAFQYSGFFFCLFSFVLALSILVLISAQLVLYPRYVRTSQDKALQIPHSWHCPCSPADCNTHFLGSRVWGLKDLRDPVHKRRVSEMLSATSLPAYGPCSLRSQSQGHHGPWTQAFPWLESGSGLRVFPCVQTSCVKLNESQYLRIWISLRNFLEEIQKLLPEGRRRDDFKGHTNRRILPNYVNGSNWNKMFTCNIFESEESYLMG